MSERRDNTIGNLGRAPARTGHIQRPVVPPPEPSSEPGAVRRWLRSMLFDNIALKFLSLVLALTVFLMVNTERDRESTERVQVTYAMPSGDHVLVSSRLDEVRVTIKGPPRRLRKLKELEPINIDLRTAPSGDIPITNDMIHLPAGVELVDLEPRTVHVAWDRRGEKVVEVAPLVTGHPLHGFALSEVTAVPATVRVRGAEGVLAALHSIGTQAVSVDGRAESLTAETKAVAPDGVELVSAPQVLAHVKIEEQLVTRKLTGLAVTVHGDGDASKWQVTPAQIDVTLTGALLAVEAAKIAPVVKLAPSETKAREADVSIEGLAPGIGVKLSPARVDVAPVK